VLRTHEAADLVVFDQRMPASALERRESRFGFLMGHWRSDHPEPDDEEWKGVATLVRYDDGPRVERRVMNPDWRSERLHEREVT
jgi:succinate dehydrogenase/fumarate reductase flavoprotein subunit